jgi:hypothetical protein
MLPANMLGTVTSSCVPCLMRSPFSRSNGMRGAPRAGPGLSKRHLDGRRPVGVAFDEPLEAEVDERRRLDEEFAGSHRICALRLRGRVRGGGDACDEDAANERKKIPHAPNATRWHRVGQPIDVLACSLHPSSNRGWTTPRGGGP